jgi:Pyridoxamine 5'-phosphate oxidase
VKVNEKIRECLRNEARSNVLATADKSGKVNLAVFGSLALADDASMIVMVGDNRTHANLRENPFAACLVTLHGKTGMQQEGCRFYLKVRAIEDGGRMFDEVKGKVRAKVGEAAEMLKHLVWFDILEVRPILDMGQGL